MSTEDKALERKGDEVLRRLLNTPPKPHEVGKANKSKAGKKKPVKASSSRSSSGR